MAAYGSRDDIGDTSAKRARVTLSDVARRANVSRATASLVLRDSPLVAAQTRRRVEDAMRQLDYVAHRGAAGLRTQRSGAVGLIVTDVSNPFFAELTTGVEERLDAAGRVVLLGSSGDAPAKQERLLGTMREYNADGLLLCPAEGTEDGTIRLLRRQRPPVVLLVRYLPAIEADYVGVDNVIGAERGTAHLIAHGHRRIAFIGGPSHSSARRDRLHGYSVALRHHGLPIDNALTPTSAPTRDGGLAAIGAVLALDDPPTAALCYNDVVAFGVMLGARAAGRVVGRDLAVIGCDDIAEAALWSPPLTTLSISPRAIGTEAADLLLERIARPNEAPRHIILTPTLRVRASCGCHRQVEEAA